MHTASVWHVQGSRSPLICFRNVPSTPYFPHLVSLYCLPSLYSKLVLLISNYTTLSSHLFTRLYRCGWITSSHFFFFFVYHILQASSLNLKEKPETKITNKRTKWPSYAFPKFTWPTIINSKNLLANSSPSAFSRLCTGFNDVGATYHATPLYPSPPCSLCHALSAVCGFQ